MADAFLFLHIVAGVTALLAAGAALGFAKGAAWHRRAGLTYVLAMLAVTLTTFVLVALRPNLFLFVIGVFSFYLVFTGWRAGAQPDGRPQWTDHLAGAAMALTGAAMLAIGAVRLFGPGGAEPVILLVFGSIGLTLGALGLARLAVRADHRASARRPPSDPDACRDCRHDHGRGGGQPVSPATGGRLAGPDGPDHAPDLLVERPHPSACPP
jgi:hypothetical protein